MPHKRNPKVAERISRPRARRARGRDRRLRERAALARARHLALLGRARRRSPTRSSRSTTCSTGSRWIVDGLVVYPERMERNLWASHGLFFSHRLLLALVESGARARTTPTGSCSATRCARGTRSATSPSSSAPIAEIAARLDDGRARTRLRPRRDDRPPRHHVRPSPPSRPQGGSRPCLKPLHVGSGKVRELYALDDERLLLVASDRISTFDVILPDGDPRQGPRADRALRASGSRARASSSRTICSPCGRTAARPSAAGSRCCRSSASCAATSPARAGRTTSRPARCAATACPKGSTSRSSCPQPIFTPATKAQTGHDENIDRAAAVELVGEDALRRGRGDGARRSTRSSRRTRASAGSSSPTRSSSSASTRTGALVLGDEAFTPDSSRFWPADEYRPGRDAAVVRQAVRARLLRVARLGQDRPRPGAARTTSSPGTRARYVEAFERLTGIEFDAYLADPNVVLG